MQLERSLRSLDSHNTLNRCTQATTPRQLASTSGHSPNVQGLEQGAPEAPFQVRASCVLPSTSPRSIGSIRKRLPCKHVPLAAASEAASERSDGIPDQRQCRVILGRSCENIAIAFKALARPPCPSHHLPGSAIAIRCAPSAASSSGSARAAGE